MNAVDRANASASSDDTYFASQHSVHNLCETVAQKDFAFLQSHEVVGLLSAIEPEALSEWHAFQESWNRLNQDRFMKDGGAYRLRRHATFSASPGKPRSSTMSR